MELSTHFGLEPSKQSQPQTKSWNNRTYRFNKKDENKRLSTKSVSLEKGIHKFHFIEDLQIINALTHSYIFDRDLELI